MVVSSGNVKSRKRKNTGEERKEDKRKRYIDDNLPTPVEYWLNEAKHDCFFLVGPERIGAMRTLLMGNSEPFRAMLGKGELAETGDIELKDVEPETFKCFLKCVYGASNVVIPKLTFEESAKLLYIVEKYLVYDIKPGLIDHLGKLFSFDNIFVALSLPICYQTESLKQEILNILKYDFDKITKDNKFLEVNDSAIIWILQQEPILVREIEIWNAVLRWAKHKTGSSDWKVLRSCIDGFLKYIRFLTMDVDEFQKDVASTEVLLKDEINDIWKSLVFMKPCSAEYLSKSRINRYNIYKVSQFLNSSILKFPRQAFIGCSVSSVYDLQLDHNNCSEHYDWEGHLWNLVVVKNKIGEDEFLGVFVVCQGKTRNWNCTVDVEINLVNQSGKPDKSSKLTRTFGPGDLHGGCAALCKWNALLNPRNKFVKDDTITLLTKVQLNNS